MTDIKQPVSTERFIAVFNDIEQYPTIRSVAKELGIGYQNVRNRAVSLRVRRARGEDLPLIANRAESVPHSEIEEKFMESWGPEECKAELQRVQAAEPQRFITRNYFRHISQISDATWNRYFGSFQEYRRQAGLELNRFQHQHERHIAKHASVDPIRLLSRERQNYADKYLRVHRDKFKTIIFASDLHDYEIDPFYLRVLIDTCKRVQPDVVSFVGDVFDLAEFGKYAVDPREWDAVGRIKFVHDHIFKPIRAACPDAQIDLIEGNHEGRLLLMLANATPALRAVLADLHGFTLGKLLGLDEFEINYIAKNELATFTSRERERELAKNYKVYFNSFLAHHFPQGKNMGLPGVNGHHHDHFVWSKFNLLYGNYEWHQLGAGHKRDASYCEGEKWGMGFDIASCNTETRSTIHDYVAITDFAVSGGKFYYREPEETGPQIILPA